MIKEIAVLYEQYKGKVLAFAAERLGLERDKIVFFGGFENFVYEHKDIILRITHSIRRTESYVMGELEFVRYLADHGVPVAVPILSPGGNLVETFPIGDGYFLITAFNKAWGHEPEESELTGVFFEKWGRLTGQIHSLTKSFQPSRPSYKRQEWYEEEVLDFEKYVPRSQELVHQRSTELFRKLNSLPVDGDVYGLTHNDIHYGNIHLHDDNLTLFDFDDCGYHWFANDIAVAVHSVLPGYHLEAEFDSITEDFLTHFMNGYREENQLSVEWLGRVPAFLRLYDLIDYGIIHQAWDLDNLNESRESILNRVRHRIENETYLVNIDFSKYGD